MTEKDSTGGTSWGWFFSFKVGGTEFLKGEWDSLLYKEDLLKSIY